LNLRYSVSLIFGRDEARRTRRKLHLLTKICLTNDDGAHSTGLRKLAELLSLEMEVVIVVPEGERSASGKALTFNRPIRMKKHKNDFGLHMIAHDGSPADSVILAHHLFNDIDLFVSGINTGANVTYQSMLTSGTVGAAIEAAIMGYPAIAVSQVVSPEEWFNNSDRERDFTAICEITRDIIRKIVKKGFPAGIDALNLNFPSALADKSEMIVTRPARMRIRNEVEKRVDPNQSPYYWVKGVEEKPQTGTDVDEVLYKGNISLSPIVIEGLTDEDLEIVRNLIS